jgi:hypothetical protein
VPGLLMDEPYELDDVLLAYLRYSPPRPICNVPTKFTLRQRFRIWRYWKRCDIEQFIHDHLDHAHCDC